WVPLHISRTGCGTLQISRAGGGLAGGAPVDAALLGRGAEGRLADRGAAAAALAAGAAEDPVQLAGTQAAGERALGAVAIGADQGDAAVDDAGQVDVTGGGAWVDRAEEQHLVDELVAEAGEVALIVQGGEDRHVGGAGEVRQRQLAVEVRI